MWHAEVLDGYVQVDNLMSKAYKNLADARLHPGLDYCFVYP